MVFTLRTAITFITITTTVADAAVVAVADVVDVVAVEAIAEEDARVSTVGHMIQQETMEENATPCSRGTRPTQL